MDFYSTVPDAFRNKGRQRIKIASDKAKFVTHVFEQILHKFKAVSIAGILKIYFLLGFFIQFITIVRTGSGYVGLARTRNSGRHVLLWDLISSLENIVLLGWQSTAGIPCSADMEIHEAV